MSYDERRLTKNEPKERRDKPEDFKRINVSYDSRNNSRGSSRCDENREMSKEIKTEKFDGIY